MIEADSSRIVRDKKRMLVITSEPPWPLNSGGHLRSFHLHNALADEIDVHMLCPVSRDRLQTLDLPKNTKFQIECVPVPKRSILSETRRVLKAQFGRQPYIMYMRHNWRPMHKRWQKVLLDLNPEFLWYDHIDSYLYHRHSIKTECTTILDMHNVYSLILSRLAMESSNPVRRLVLSIEARRMARIELQACRAVDIVIAVSQSEADHFKKLGAKRIWLAPNGVLSKHKHYRTVATRTDSSRIILFLGAMNWQPNVSAALHLVKNIFPIIKKRYPDSQLKLVGKDPVASVRELKNVPGVTVTGTVADVKPYLSEATVMVVPLESGGGTRLKILESFAAGLPVISTPVGVEGIDAEDGVHIHVAELEDFPKIILKVFENMADESMISNAQQLVQRKYNWASIASDTRNFLQCSRRLSSDDD